MLKQKQEQRDVKRLVQATAQEASVLMICEVTKTPP